ncbi:adenylyl-sulfate kinase [Salidesulfovibrio onnuriiensis]|uniref:adenylyl-sulfate kinase n=1 Tax=Salidesulfovibrio onnuriiensis TaxID=2583823 RepID=UPI00202B1626|nr:adenylyl-sulfate kinase [Salidesulfovibrio onnuriiensis]
MARCVYDHLVAAGHDVVHHEMDRRRKAYFPKPRYTEAERARAYSLFIDEAVTMAAQGKVVLMDASAHRAVIRQAARKKIGRFAEIMIRCSLETAMAREKARPEGLVIANMYEKALIRQKTGEQFEGLGDVIGVDVPFEEGDAELIVDNTNLTSQQTCTMVTTFLDTWLDNA